MEFDELQKAWQAQSYSAESVNEEAMVRKVLQASRGLRLGVLWRDTLESVVALVVAGFFAYGARSAQYAWAWHVAAACYVWIAVYLTVHHWTHRERRLTTTVREALEQALRHLDHQIHLLKSVLVWYILPGVLGVVLIIGETSLRFVDTMGIGSLRTLPIPLGVILGVGVFVYWLNQRGVKNDLLPLRTELEAALNELEDQA